MQVIQRAANKQFNLNPFLFIIRSRPDIQTIIVSLITVVKIRKNSF